MLVGVGVGVAVGGGGGVLVGVGVGGTSVGVGVGVSVGGTSVDVGVGVIPQAIVQSALEKCTLLSNQYQKTLVLVLFQFELDKHLAP